MRRRPSASKQVAPIVQKTVLDTTHLESRIPRLGGQSAPHAEYSYEARLVNIIALAVFLSITDSETCVWKLQNSEYSTTENPALSSIRAGLRDLVA